MQLAALLPFPAGTGVLRNPTFPCPHSLWPSQLGKWWLQPAKLLQMGIKSTPPSDQTGLCIQARGAGEDGAKGLLDVSLTFSWVQTRVPVLEDTGGVYKLGADMAPTFWHIRSSKGTACCSLVSSVLPSQDYYGKELQKSEDLKTNACVTSSRPPLKVVRDALERVHEEVVAR